MQGGVVRTLKRSGQDECGYAGRGGDGVEVSAEIHPEQYFVENFGVEVLRASLSDALRMTAIIF